MKQPFVVPGPPVTTRDAKVLLAEKVLITAEEELAVIELPFFEDGQKKVVYQTLDQTGIQCVVDALISVSTADSRIVQCVHCQRWYRIAHKGQKYCSSRCGVYARQARMSAAATPVHIGDSDMVPMCGHGDPECVPTLGWAIKVGDLCGAPVCRECELVWVNAQAQIKVTP